MERKGCLKRISLLPPSLAGVQRGAVDQRRDRHLSRALPVARGHRLPPRPQIAHRLHLLPLPPHLLGDGRQAPGKKETATAISLVLFSLHPYIFRTLKFSSSVMISSRTAFLSLSLDVFSFAPKM